MLTALMPADWESQWVSSLVQKAKSDSICRWYFLFPLLVCYPKVVPCVVRVSLTFDMLYFSGSTVERKTEGFIVVVQAVIAFNYRAVAV